MIVLGIRRKEKVMKSMRMAVAIAVALVTAGVVYAQAKITFEKKAFSATSSLSPALAFLKGRLYVAWRGSGEAHRLNIMYSDNGQTFGHRYVSEEDSDAAPALAVFNDALYIAWKGMGNNNLNVAI